EQSCDCAAVPPPPAPFGGSNPPRPAGGPDAGPPPPSGPAAVLFSGDGPSFLDDTWTFDGASWYERASSGAPTSRVRHAMATLGGKVVLYGGVGASADTWELDPATWTWTKKTIPGPGERAFFAMATMGSKIVLFGGEKDANHFEDDTWEYDGAAWTQRTV